MYDIVDFVVNAAGFQNKYLPCYDICKICGSLEAKNVIWARQHKNMLAEKLKFSHYVQC